MVLIELVELGGACTVWWSLNIHEADGHICFCALLTLADLDCLRMSRGQAEAIT